jgi:hypothetical protein
MLVADILERISAKLAFTYINNIEVVFHDSRESINNAIGRSTECWEVAFASMGNSENRINIISPEQLENHSCHKEKEFNDIITHELTHLVVNDIANGSAIPIWLSEGLSNWLCTDNSHRKEELFYIDTSLLEKIGTPKGWKDMDSGNIYSLSYFLVDFLVGRFSLEKIKEILVSLDKHYYYPRFRNILKSVLGVSPEEIEELFVESITSKK